MLRNEMGKGAYISAISGEKFKRALLVAHLVLPAERAIANELALLPHVLERRCAAISDPLVLSRTLFDLYGAELNAESHMAGANRVLSISVSGLKNEFALGGEDLESRYVELCCQLLFEPVLENSAFAHEDVQIERAKQMDFLKSEFNDKRSYCLRQAARALYGDTPLGIESAGYLEEMEQVTPQSLFSAYETLLSMAQIEIYCCGIDTEKVCSGFEKYLSQRARSPLAPHTRMAVQTPGEFLKKSETMDTSQGKLCLIATNGQVAKSRQDAVMRLGSALLGGLPTSRFFMNVREKQSLCYYCSSSYTPLRGTLMMDSGIEHKNAERAAEAMLFEFSKMQQAPVSAEELATAKRAIRTAFLAAKDSPDALLSWAFNEQMRESSLSLEEGMELIESVQQDEVQEAMAAYTPSLQYVLSNKEGV